MHKKVRMEIRRKCDLQGWDFRNDVGTSSLKAVVYDLRAKSLPLTIRVMPIQHLSGLGRNRARTLVASF